MNLTDTKKNEKLRQTIRKTTPVIHILHLANRHDHLSKFETQLELLKNSARELGLTVLKNKEGGTRAKSWKYIFAESDVCDFESENDACKHEGCN